MISPTDESVPSKKNNPLLTLLESRLADLTEYLWRVCENINEYKKKVDFNEIQNIIVAAAEAATTLRAVNDIVATLIKEEK